jgi:hypothetical protein
VRIHLPTRPVEIKLRASAQSLSFQDFACDNADRSPASPVESASWLGPSARIRPDLPPNSLFWNILRISSLFPRFCEQQNGSQPASPTKSIFWLSRQKKMRSTYSKVASTIETAPPFAILERHDDVASQDRWIACARLGFGRYRASCVVRTSTITIGNCKFCQSKSYRLSCISSERETFFYPAASDESLFPATKAL